LPGLTRQSIIDNEVFLMDARVKPAHDEEMPDAKLIGLDWGTTSCRAYLIGADGMIQARVEDGPGVLRVGNDAFGVALDAMIGGWPSLPIVLSGMIGSRQGWKEAPYARCPAGAGEIVAALARVEHGRRSIRLVPGLSTKNGGMPDVMRGEETQVIGALAVSGESGGLFLLPGTHSKWAEVAEGRIISFRSEERRVGKECRSRWSPYH